jgi:hypothetical protein
MTSSQLPIVASDQSSGGGAADGIKFKSTIVSLRKSLEVQESRNIQQTQEISALRGTVDALRTETATLNNGLTSISNLIQQDSALEKQQNAQEVERERRLLETRIRMGKESQLEQKITNSLASPVQALQSKVTDIFGKITEALKILFTGWLTNQLIETLKAASDGNKNKLEEIKDNVLKGIGDVVKIFAVIQKGFGLVIKSVTGLAGRIGGLVLKLATAPIKALTNVVRGAPLLTNVFGGPKKPGGGGGGGLLGGVITGISGALNFLNGENADAALAGISLLPIPGKVGLAVKVLAGGIFAIDDVLEVFDKNFIGADPKALAEKKKELEEAKRNQTNQKPPASTPTTAAKVEPAAKAQTSLMGDKKDEKSKTDPKNMTSGPVPGSVEIKPTSDSTTTASSPKTSVMPETKKPDTASTPKTSLVTDMKTAEPKSTSPSTTAQTPMLKQSLVVANGTEEKASKAGKISNPVKMDIPGFALIGKVTEFGVDKTDIKPLTTEKSPVVPAEVTAAKMQPLPKSTQNVGELPEPKPSVIMAPAAQNQPQQSSAPSLPTNGTNVPLISSSNPDNFYVLYSQLNYNVVI